MADDEILRDDAAPHARPGSTPRRPYNRPQLVEYGSIAKLTQGTRSVGSDAPSAGFRMNCL
jgi:hypothetical protein